MRPLSRRKFIQRSTCSVAGSMAAPFIVSSRTTNYSKIPIVGHGTHQYRVSYNWGNLDPYRVPVNDCHEMVQDSRGRIILLTNETRNNVIIYDQSGKLLETWGHEYPGAHGLTLAQENDQDLLFISDYERHQVIKTTLDGRVLMTINFPQETGKYENPEQFLPTEVAVAPNGDFYVVDGYGQQYITQYNHRGELLRIFGGQGDGPDNFQNAHGICVDLRNRDNPSLLVTARVANAVKRFTLEGEYLETITLPGAYICRPVIDDENIYFAVLISRMPWNSETGYLLILDKNNNVISCPGGSDPAYEGDELLKMYQVAQVFKHPHDVCIDGDKNLYVAQWNSGRSYPIKLERI